MNPKTLQIKIGGLSCSFCIAGITKALSSALLTLAMLAVPPASWAKDRITVEVGGVSCPFCAFGLEKKLKQLPGAEKVKIRVDEGKAVVEFKEGSKITKEEIEKAVRDAGFTPGKIQIEGEAGTP